MVLKKTSSGPQLGIVPARKATAVAARPVNSALASLEAIGGVDASELIIPTATLMQPLSTQVMKGGTKAKPGHFYHATLDTDLGPSLRCVVLRKDHSYELWGDRDSQQGLLAVADKHGQWDKPHQSFEVPAKTGMITYETKGSLAESGLDDWGSFDPNDDSNKKKAVALTYRIVLHLVDNPDLSPIMLVVRRMPAVRLQESLIPRLLQRARKGEDVNQQIYKLYAEMEERKGFRYFIVKAENDGLINDPALAAELADRTASYAAVKIVAAGDTGDDEAPRGPSGPREYNYDDEGAL